MTESCECATIKFGLPNALAFCRKLLTWPHIAGVQGVGKSGILPDGPT